MPAGAPPPISLPPDVADAPGLREFLKQTTVFGAQTADRDAYIDDALERFRITMALVPEETGGARLLELGSNPYFITRLLRRRGYAVTCANWFGPEPWGRHGQQEIDSARGGDIVDFDNFNVEDETFPYPDEAFDVALCCEILEHLPGDPIHLLAELHRVLKKPDGRLILTTPNATRWENLRLMFHGDNVYEHLSGHGVYGRHNREYTLGELRTLLPACGYEVDTAFAADLHDRRPDDAVAASGANLADRGENLFVVARPVGTRRWAYPAWLYSSRHALQRIVRPDLVMGVNCDLQSRGFHELETVGGIEGRWSGLGDVVEVDLWSEEAGRRELRIEGLAPPPVAGAALSLRAAIGTHEVAWTVPCDASRFAVDADVPVSAGATVVRLTTDRTWRPCDVGGGEDRRRLGVMVSTVRLLPVGVPASPGAVVPLPDRPAPQTVDEGPALRG